MRPELQCKNSWFRELNYLPHYVSIAIAVAVWTIHSTFVVGMVVSGGSFRLPCGLPNHLDCYALVLSALRVFPYIPDLYSPSYMVKRVTHRGLKQEPNILSHRRANSTVKNFLSLQRNFVHMFFGYASSERITFT